MITEIVAGVSGVTSLATIVWLVHGRIKAADQVADARMAQGDTESHVERLQFELETATKAYEAEKRRSNALQEVLDDVSNAPLGSDLSPSDWRGRLSRITQSWGDAAEVRVSPDREPGGLSSDAAAESPASTTMSPIGDVLR